ncbi:uncharacterized protein LOC114574925 [Exaiptasia diaphana]|uniref:Uncharacterized protein n=1 Tax=Exaiptasia diaphana TaxID=2652724 RepID=A0A913YIX1_EXADI|nr:uncharacterized protein LOC114574925 [Exaiptasia diaphana]
MTTTLSTDDDLVPTGVLFCRSQSPDSYRQNDLSQETESKKRKMTDFFASSSPKKANLGNNANTSNHLICLPREEQPIFSLDNGDEFGITLLLQPPLPPPNPPSSYPPNQCRRWWVKKENVASIKLNDALSEIKDLFESDHTFTLQYFDGIQQMPIVNDKDLQSCLRYFSANASNVKYNTNLCRIYLEKKVTKIKECFKASIQVESKKAALTREVTDAVLNRTDTSKEKGRKKRRVEERLEEFCARVLSKHGDKAKVINKGTVQCLYEKSCNKNVACKEYNIQNFEKHVKSCHSSKTTHGEDIRMLLTLIAQNQKKTVPMSEEPESRAENSNAKNSDAESSDVEALGIA